MKKLLVGGAGVAAGLGLASAGAAAYVAKMVQGRATGDIDGLLDNKDPDPRDVVVCLGASIVRGRASVDFVEMLRDRLPQLQFVNGGVNNETADDVLQRLDAVIACQPKAILILIGTNDAQAILDPTGAVARRRQKASGSTQPPSVQDYQRNLQAIVSELVERTGARIGLCSIPPLGQQIDSPANDAVREINTAIRATADATGETYVPVYEEMIAYLESADATDGPAFTGDWRIGARSLSQHFIVGRSYDAIAEREGLLLSPDYIHLNTAGASIVADASAEFLAGLVTKSPYGDAVTVKPVVTMIPEPVEPAADEATPESADPAQTQPSAQSEQTEADAVEPSGEADSSEATAAGRRESTAAEVADSNPTASEANQPEGPQTPLTDARDSTSDPVPAPRVSQPGPFEPAANVEPEAAPASKNGPSPYGG